MVHGSKPKIHHKSMADDIAAYIRSMEGFHRSIIYTHTNCRINKIEKELITFKSDKLETYCKKLNSPKVSLLAALESINNEDRVTKKEIYK